MRTSLAFLSSKARDTSAVRVSQVKLGLLRHCSLKKFFCFFGVISGISIRHFVETFLAIGDKLGARQRDQSPLWLVVGCTVGIAGVFEPGAHPTEIIELPRDELFRDAGREGDVRLPLLFIEMLPLTLAEVVGQRIIGMLHSKSHTFSSERGEVRECRSKVVLLAYMDQGHRLRLAGLPVVSAGHPEHPRGVRDDVRVARNPCWSTRALSPWAYPFQVIGSSSVVLAQ